MHYYNFNVGDYLSHTRHLSLIEDLAYRRMLDVYYLNERPLNECSTSVARVINMRDNVAEVDAVLKEFFTFVEGVGWVNKRADAEVSAYKLKVEAASRAGKASAQRRLNERSTDVQLNRKQETENIKQEINIKKEIYKEKKESRATRSVISKPDCVDETVWNDWLQHRKLKKAVVTETVLKTIEREALKASMTLQDALETMCSRGWTGFKADWMLNGNIQAAKKQQNLCAFDEFLCEQNILEFNNQTGEWK